MFSSSYRTYEEWKLTKFFSTKGGDKVLTVPMRNGNFHPPQDRVERLQFLPYLWGMETWMWESIARSLSPVLTVPMRNGNYDTYAPNGRVLEFLPYLWGMETSPWRCQIWPRTLFLPYLWGMETICHFPTSFTQPLVLTVPMRNGNETALTISRSKKGSYRTYEEWKPSYRPLRNQRPFMFLPYLWGMETELLGITEDSDLVLTVPMRNGNKNTSTQINIIIWFLPYLWGMETRRYKMPVSAKVGSYRTYEEWKLLTLLWVSHSLLWAFLPYLWGMETTNEAGGWT